MPSTIPVPGKRAAVDADAVLEEEVAGSEVPLSEDGSNFAREPIQGELGTWLGMSFEGEKIHAMRQ